mmetsp:Transcript_1331/g.1779  ORF Transcript_1331/g.1779 Transcript_1331/m.1779 type:complete len:225 (+) Transcript_1331:660-1334(+)
MDDVLGHVVLTGRNKDLGAGDSVSAIGIRLRLGAKGAEIRTAVRLGQTHRTSPLAADQLGEVSLLLLFGAMLFNGVGCAVAQAGVHAKGPVGSTNHLAHNNAQGTRQPLPTIVGISVHGRPAALNVLLIGFLEASRCLHTVFAPGTAFFVTYLVQRRQNLLTELGTFRDNGIHHIRSSVFGTFQVGIVLLTVKQLVHYEFDVTQGRFVLRHGIHLGSRSQLNQV